MDDETKVDGTQAHGAAPEFEVKMVAQLVVVMRDGEASGMELLLNPEVSGVNAVQIMNSLGNATRDLGWCLAQLQRHAKAQPQAEAAE